MEFAQLTRQPAGFSWSRDFPRGNAMDIHLAWWPEGWEIGLAFPSGPYRGIYSGRPPFRCSPEAPVEALALVICELITEHTRKDRLAGDNSGWRDGVANVGRIYEVSPPWWDLARAEWPVHKTAQQILDKRLPAGVVAPDAKSDRLWFIVPAGHALGAAEAQRLADEMTSELDGLKPAEIA